MNWIQTFFYCAALAHFSGAAGEAAPVAKDAPAGVKAITHRLYGLFCVERENDLRAIVKEFSGVKLLKVDFDAAEATFEYDPAKLSAEQLGHLLAQASDSTFTFAPASKLPKEKLTRIEIPVAGLDCKACSYGAYDSICKLDGVDRATASFKLGLVTAWIDPTKTNLEALVAALKKREVDVKPH